MPKIMFTGYVVLTAEEYGDIDDIGTVDNWLARAFDKAVKVGNRSAGDGLEALEKLNIKWDLRA